MNGSPLKTGFTRVFIINNRAGPERAPYFQSCMRAGAVDWALGDIEKIECPSPSRYGEFDEVGQIRGAKDRPTTTLEGRYAADFASVLLALARQGCEADVQVHMGACTDPRAFDTFTKALIYEGAIITNYGTDELGALESGDNAVVNENVDISAKDFYEVLPLDAIERGGTTVTNPLNDVVICSAVSCGDCEDPDWGCEKIYAVGDSTPGSPGTAPDVVYSLDSGATFAADEITTLIPGNSADGVACLGDYVIVVSNSGGGHSWKLKATINAGTAGGWAEETASYTSGAPNDIWSVGNYAFIAGDNGYVYGLADATADPTTLDAGVVTTEDLNAIHALNDQFAVAVGDAGVVIFTDTRDVWEPATVPVVAQLNCVWVKSEKEWWVGTNTGRVYYTEDEGVTWTEKTGLPLTLSVVHDIAFSTPSVGYIAAQTGLFPGQRGHILRTYNGGYTWKAIPEGVTSFPLNDWIEGIAACVNNANFVVGVGTADNNTDGIIVVATA